MPHRIATLACFRSIAAWTAAAASATACLAGEGPRQYTVFVGADFIVGRGNDDGAVVDVSAKAVEVANDSGREVIPFDKVAWIRMDRKVRIGTAEIVISNLDAQRAYTPENNPILKAMEVDMAMRRQHAATQALAEAAIAAEASPNNGMMQANLSAAKAAMGGGLAVDQLATDFAENRRDMPAPYDDTQSTNMMAGGAMEAFDAVEVTLNIAANDVFTDAYALLITRIHDSRGTPPRTYDRFYTRKLGQIDGDGRKVRLFQGGFPPGYKLEKCFVHIYQQGREIPSNLSEKKINVSEAQAYQFLVLDYLANNKGMNLDPRPAWRALDQNPFLGLNGAHLGQFIDIDVKEDGTVWDVRVDPAGGTKIDPVLKSAVSRLQFFPALEAGKPVRKQIRVRLRDWQA